LTLVAAVLGGVLCCAASFVAVPTCALAAEGSAQAYKLYQAKRYKEAAQMFETCFVSEPPNATVYYYAAVCNQQSGNLGRAKYLYKQVVLMSPGTAIGQYADKILRQLEPLPHTTSNGDPAPSTSFRRDTTAESNSVVSGPEEGAIYYRETGKQMLVPVEINNRSIEMLLDTGAPEITIGRDQIEKIGIRPPDGKALGTTGGSSNDARQNYWSMSATIKVGPYSIANCPLAVINNNQAEPLIGQGFLKFFDYTVDQSAKCIRLRRKGGSIAAASRSGQFIPFVFQESGNRIVVDVEINGKKLPMILDTGNTASGISFFSSAQAKQYGLVPPDDAITTSHYGVSGSGKCLEYSASHVRLGPIDKNNVRVSMHLETNVSELPLLGHEFFEGWQYNIDLAERKIWLLHR